VIEGDQINRVTAKTIGAAIEVHRELGPGLLESSYQACLAHELKLRGFVVELAKELPVVYKGLKLDCVYRIDLLVEHTVIVELKAVQELDPIHEAQVLSYLKLSGCPVGLLVNFNVRQLVPGDQTIPGLSESLRPRVGVPDGLAVTFAGGGSSNEPSRTL
jgi:GxxExxY protein